MAIAFDTEVDKQGVFVNTVSWSHTFSGSDRLLFVSMAFSLVPGLTVSSATCGGVAMTPLNSGAPITASGGIKAYGWFLVAPASGAQTIQINVSSAGDVLACYSASYTGCNQSGVPSVVVINTTAGTPCATNLTTLQDNSWCVLMGTGGQTAGTNSTKRHTSSQSQNGGFYDSGGPVTPAGSFTMTVSDVSGNAWFMVAFDPVPPGIPITLTATQAQTATLGKVSLRPKTLTATQGSTAYLITQQVFAPTEIDEHTDIASIAGLRPQPYRLDLGQVGSIDELNRRLPELISNADFMFQMLFEDLKLVNDALGDGTALGVTEVENDVNVTGLITGSTIALGWTGFLSVPRGGTGRGSATAFAVVCGGTTSFGALQSVVGSGTVGQVLTSNGPGALPTWQ